MSTQNVVVIGAGVAGLTTALLLSRDDRYSVTVAAKYMPGDYSIEYASPWAGANFMPVSLKDTKAAKWDADTWVELEHLARNNPGSGIHFQKCNIYSRDKDAGSATAEWFADLMSPEPWWKDLFHDFQQIPKDELSPGIDHGTQFTSVCINTAIYLPWLVSQCLNNGVVFKRAQFQHIVEAATRGVHHSSHSADLVVNCTGLSSLHLGGVEDRKLYPARAQIVLVSNAAGAMYSASGTDDGPEEAMYIMTRAAGGGTILGGCYQKDNWQAEPDPSLALRIMERCVEVCPELTGGRGVESLDVIRHSVGLRPARHGGARVESETIDGVRVVHNYGHGGSGYQCSYGCALAAVELAKNLLVSRARL